MSKRKEKKTHLDLFGSQSTSGGMWADTPKAPEPEKAPEPDPAPEEGRRYEDEDDKYDKFARRGRGGPRGGYRDNPDSLRQRDHRFAEQRRREEGDDRRDRYTTAGGGGGYHGGPRRYDREGGGYSHRPYQPDFRRKEQEVVIEPPYIVIVSDLPANIEVLQIGEFFEKRGCAIEDINLDGNTAELELNDEASVRKALEQSKQLIDECAITVRLKPKDDQKQEYVPPSGATHAQEDGLDRPPRRFDHDHERGGYRSYRGRGGRGRGGYRRDDDYRRDDYRGGYRRDDDYRRDDYRGGYRRDDDYRRDDYRRDDYRRDDYRREERQSEPKEEATDGPRKKPVFTVPQPKKQAAPNPFGEATPKDTGKDTE